jgi:hypothetical protein
MQSKYPAAVEAPPMKIKIKIAPVKPPKSKKKIAVVAFG